jgi:PAS domain S-box-containing protein
MTTQGPAEAQILDDVPVRKLLEGLARIYQLVLVIDRNGRIEWMSDELCVLCGDSDLHLGHDAREIVPRLPKPEQAFAIRSRLRRRGALANMPVEIHGRDGSTLPVAVSILPVSANGGEPSFFVAIARPAGDEERVPAASGGLSEAILESAPGAVLAVDERGFVSRANAAVSRLLGQPREDIVGQPVALLLSDPAELERLLGSIGVPHGREEADFTLQRGDGHPIRVSVSASPLERDGEIRGTVLFLHDVTEGRRARDELERANDELEHCVNTLAHDLRSPLVALLGFSRLLRQDFGARLDETGLHFVDRIEQAGRTMEALIHDLLELSRIGRAGERRTLVDPKAVLSQLKAELKPRLEAQSIELRLPESPPMLFCDRTRLYQVFSNLIGNAINHMGPSRNPWIEVSILEEPDTHHVVVRDGGRGIPAEHHERIFEVFQSLPTSADNRTGTGIGLAIVRKIAETHGGRVWVESLPGAGATFHVCLPHR